MDTITANISATILANQIPLNPKRIGRINTDDNWNTNTRRKDTAAEIGPLPKAVKNDEVKMLMPASTKQNEKIRKAVIVIDNSSASYPTNIAEITGASVNPRIAISTPEILMIFRLLRRIFCNSLKLPAP